MAVVRSRSARGSVPEFLRDGGSLESAYESAARAHDGQTRKGDGSPYIGHPVTVARLCRESGADDAVVAGAVLHDVVEDTDMEIAEVESGFGPDVAALVAALTEDKTIGDYSERKHAHRERVAAAGPRAATIYAADKLANVRDMRELYSRVAEDAAQRFTAPLDLRFRLWEEDVEMLARVAPDLALVEELRVEVEALGAERERRRDSA